MGPTLVHQIIRLEPVRRGDRRRGILDNDAGLREELTPRRSSDRAEPGGPQSSLRMDEDKTIPKNQHRHVSSPVGVNQAAITARGRGIVPRGAPVAGVPRRRGTAGQWDGRWNLWHALPGRNALPDSLHLISPVTAKTRGGQVSNPNCLTRIRRSR